MIAAVYFLAERLLLRIHNGIAVLIQGIALGLLSNKQLEGLTVLRYSTEASVASYSEPSYVNSGLFTWERETIQRFFPRGGRILVAAAGAGREMIALARAGFAVDGFDCSSLLVEAGRQELQKQKIDAKLHYVPSSAVPTHGGHYDAVLVGFSGYMYIPGRDRRIRFLRDLCGFLDTDAPVMVSFTEGSYGKRRAWTAKIGTALRMLRRAESVEEGDCLKAGFQHHFVQQQIVSEMSEAGLRIAYYSGGTCYGHAVGLVRPDLAGRDRPTALRAADAPPAAHTHV